MSVSDTWTITNTRHDAHALGQYNSVFTISNGYLGLTGNLQEDRDGCGPVTLINGVYDEIDQFGTLRASNQERRYLDPRYFDTAGKSPAVANLPSPLFVRVYVDDRELSLGRGEVVNFSQSLDLRTGVYRYAYDYRDAAGRTTRLEMARFASLTRAHRVCMRFTLTPIDHDAPIRVLSGIDARVYSNTTRERQFVVADARVDSAERCTLRARTNARRHDVYLAVQHSCRDTSPRPELRGVVEHDSVYTCYEFAPKNVAAGPRTDRTEEQTITIDRCIVLTCSEDGRHGVAVELENELAAAARQGFDAALDQQRAAWAALWERADVQIDGDEQAQRYLRFCLHHLLAAAPRYSDKLSVPVKLLTGEYYQGNTFWDTDLCIVPFYTFTFPELAGTCLNFRYEGLKPGRQIARELGYAGAKFAWQAGPYGEECLGKWYRFVHTNIHINADIVYSLMQYLRATGDESFLRERGVDILVETARFYASRAKHDPARDAYDIRDVAGPDEGHCESTNNFYTNYLAIRNLRWAADALDRLRTKNASAFAAIRQRVHLNEDEPHVWRRVADRLTLRFDPKTKVYEQYDGFYQLKPVPDDLLKDRQEWFATVFPYQALNQPDVVMALVLFRDDFDGDVRRANWEFYKDKSMDFSSMSFAINAIAAADVGNLDEAYRNFIIAAGMDLDEELTGRRDTHAGLHGTAMGGAWLAAVFGFGGVSISENGPRINPKLPAKWTSLRFNLLLRGEVVNVNIGRREIVLTAENKRGVELALSVAGRAKTLRSGETVRVSYAS
ncbi:MAG: glycoside hydrolase family 65 protein [Phycisphaerae bacterium]